MNRILIVSLFRRGGEVSNDGAYDVVRRSICYVCGEVVLISEFLDLRNKQAAKKERQILIYEL